MEGLGARAIAIPANVADAGPVEDAAATAERELGAIDVWVNNSMLSVFSPVKELRTDEVRRVTEATYLGAVHGTLSALRRMLPRDRGVIVQVGSALAYRAIPLQAAYCGAKHALQGFTESLRCELIHDASRVHVTMVHLPALNTPQFGWVKSRLPNRAQPVPPIFQPEVAADAVVYASEHRRREINVAWPTLKAIYGNKIAPAYADRYLARNGYAAQQTGEPEDADRTHNLWEPVPGDHGARGRFDERAHGTSIAWELDKRRRLVAGALGGLAGLALLASALRGR